MSRLPAPETRPRRAARLVAALLAAVLVAPALAGCGVRFETVPPTEPIPDALEQVRRAAVTDALGVADLATAAQDAADLPEPVDAELTRIAADAHRHAEELGGVYVSGLETDDVDASPEPEPTAAANDPAAVVSALTDAAGRNRTAATTTVDGGMARLLASIGAAQTVSATRLAALADVEGPAAVTPVVPAPPDADEPEASDEPDDDASPSGIATTTPGEAPVPPEGMTASDYEALVLAEDGARYALQLRAAQTSGDERARLLARSVQHGERAQAWATLGSIAGTPQDPRRVAYEVPRTDDDATLVRVLHTGLAVDYASLVGTTTATTRGVLVDLVIDAALTLDAWGAPPSAFPGLPEQADTK